MKNILFILFIMNVNFGFSQEPNSEYKYIFELEKTQELTWKSIEKEWIDEVYNPYVKKLKIDISNCRKCGDLYIDFEATINANGQLTINASIAKKCGKTMNPELEQIFMTYFLIKKFPENLRNLKIQHRLGILYKC
jgi:predicted membrane protein